MAPFLRISFNSYELGSLKAADEASQPFCAVKMKEALSTGRAGGWTPPTLQPLATGNCQWCRELRARRRRQWEELCLVLLELLRDPSLPCPHLPAQLTWQCRTVETTHLPIGPPALAIWNLPWGPGLLVPPNLLFCPRMGSLQELHVSICASLCWEQRTLPCSKADQALPSWGSQSGGGARQ